MTRPRGSWQRAAAASSRAGRASTKVSSSSRVTTSGGARRIASGATGLTMKPASRASAATCGGHRLGQHDRPQQPGSPDLRHERVAQGGHGVDEVLRRPRPHARAGPPSSIVSSTARPAAAASGLPPKVLPCWPAVSRPGDLGAEGDQRADRDAPAEPLGQRDGVGHHPRLLEREPGCRCGRCRSGSRRGRAGHRARG